MPRFLSTSRDSVCFLVDLCHDPVNGMPGPRRRLAREAGISDLRATTRETFPAIIIVVMKAIEECVLVAAAEARLSHVPRRVLPFPAQGHQREYVAQLTMVLRGIFKESG
jgi:hypothetical protein